MRQIAIERLLEFQLEAKLLIEQSRNMRKQTERREIKQVVSVLLITVFLHIILAFNRTYSVFGRNYSSELYHTYLDNVPEGFKMQIIPNTKVSYFNLLPEWTPYIFYAMYFATILWGLYKFNNRNI